MQWLPLPVNLSGDGYTLTMEQEDGPALFGTWCAILQVAAQCSPRGTLQRSNGVAYDCVSLARRCRIPAPTCERALKWFSSQDVMWIAHEGAGIPQDGVLQEGKEGKKTSKARAPEVPSNSNSKIVAQPNGFERIDIKIGGDTIPWLQVSGWVRRLNGDYQTIWQILHYASKHADNPAAYAQSLIRDGAFESARESVTVQKALDWRDSLYAKE